MITWHEYRITRTKHVALEFSVTSHQRISGNMRSLIHSLS